MAEPLVCLQNVTKTYGTTVKTTVLNQVNLAIDEKEFLGIIGPSGSGKSTMLNLIGALDRPTSGTIRIGGENITTLGDDALADFRNQSLGFVFQFHHLLPEFTALENVLIPNMIRSGTPNREILARAEELVRLVGLWDRRDNRANAISGGQQQRIAIARALMNRPRLVLADEPTGNLDSESTTQIYDLLRNINRELGTTFIIITHDRHIAALCDRVVEMVDGEIVREVATHGSTADAAWQTLAPRHCIIHH